VSPPPAKAWTLESFQAVTRIRPSSSTSTPSKRPLPEATSVGVESLRPRANSLLSNGWKVTTSQRALRASQVTPFGKVMGPTWVTVRIARPGPTEKIRSPPRWITPHSVMSMPVSVT
jgi:hypothetical protein